MAVEFCVSTERSCSMKDSNNFKVIAHHSSFYGCYAFTSFAN